MKSPSCRQRRGCKMDDDRALEISKIFETPVGRWHVELKFNSPKIYRCVPPVNLGGFSLKTHTRKPGGRETRLATHLRAGQRPVGARTAAGWARELSRLVFSKRDTGSASLGVGETRPCHFSDGRRNMDPRTPSLPTAETCRFARITF
jgi:hypothetical protein